MNVHVMASDSTDSGLPNVKKFVAMLKLAHSAAMSPVDDSVSQAERQARDSTALTAFRSACRYLDTHLKGDWEKLLAGKVKVIGDPFGDIPAPPPTDRSSQWAKPAPNPQPQASQPAGPPPMQGGVRGSGSGPQASSYGSGFTTAGTSTGRFSSGPAQPQAKPQPRPKPFTQPPPPTCHDTRQINMCFNTLSQYDISQATHNATDGNTALNNIKAYFKQHSYVLQADFNWMMGLVQKCRKSIYPRIATASGLASKLGI